MIEYILIAFGVLGLLYVAWRHDRAGHHPYLGLGDEQTKIEAGAEWHDCPDCGGRTAVYEKQSGYTMCGNCGAGVGWNPETEEVYLERSGDEMEPYEWRAL